MWRRMAIRLTLKESKVDHCRSSVQMIMTKKFTHTLFVRRRQKIFQFKEGECDPKLFFLELAIYAFKTEHKFKRYSLKLRLENILNACR
jgi:hypothetical protein